MRQLEALDVKSVVCLLTDRELAERGLGNWDNLLSELRVHGVTRGAHCPLDFGMSSGKAFFEAAKTLNQVADQRCFVFCSSGVSRGPTLVALW